MAAGDFTITSTGLGITGNRQSVTGTVEVDGTRRAFAVLPNHFILPGTFKLFGKDNAGSVEVDANEGTDGTATNGTVSLMSATVDSSTYTWSCEFA